ncbi:hypothetical protein B9Z55_010743 [Caenorhabditis nigoni]|uniref:Uncharacterized protein n=2 Tax=Caenorhabditis nigoni TaxID=1611254 RepID=A0A2G5UHR8_9PELO|nr:hypothetical protein B9Z55_010743 [Caenorhabditis nigoni]
MIAAVIPIYVIVLCNISHIVLAIFFFPSIVDFLDDLHWGFTHRSWFIEYVGDTEISWKAKKFISHSNESILMDRADLYEKNEAVAQQRRDVVNYYFSEDKEFDEYMNIRENRKMLQQAYDDSILIRKQNFRARIHERMVEQPATAKKTLARSR